MASPVIRSTKGEDGIWRKNPEIGNENGKILREEIEKRAITTIPQLFEFSVEKFGEKPCMGTRSVLRKTTEEVNGKTVEKLELGDYAWKSYTDIDKKSKLVSKALVNYLKLVPSVSKVAIFAETRSDWYTFAIGSLRVSIPVVTLYTNLSDDNVVYGIEQTKVETIVTSYEFLQRIKNILPTLSYVKNIIVFEDQLEGVGDVTNISDNVKVIPFSELCSEGSKVSEELSDYTSKFDDTAIIMYTSGSTGTPKGVELTHRSIYSSVTAYAIQAHINNEDRYLAFLPLAHVMEFVTETAMLLSGSSIAYSSAHTLTNNSPKVMEGSEGDARVAKPTSITTVPLILDRIIKGVMANVEKQGKLKSSLFHGSLQYKQGLEGYDGGILSGLLNSVIFNKVKAELGGQVKMMVVGGAPLSKRTHKAIRAMFGCTLQTGYGLTESTACLSSMDRDDNTTNHVGPPNPGVLVKLESWEEGGYRVTDLPNPRGEIVVGGGVVARGYYNMPELTSATFFDEGGIHWFRTGDIGQFDERGNLSIIDRKKDLVKLQHGEYVSLGNVESILKTHPSVDNICVFADSSQCNTVAVVVPSSEHIMSVGSSVLKKKQDLTYQELCDEPLVVSNVLKNLQFHGKNQKLSKFELPVALFLSPDHWTPDNELVTAALKLRREKICSRYADQVASMYASIMAA